VAPLRDPYLLFLGDAPEPLAAKTANAIFHWRPEKCVGQVRLPGCAVSLALPELDPVEAVARGARTMVVGVANRGGILAPGWVETMVRALDAGLDVAAGLHDRLHDVPELVAAARRAGRALVDVRHPRADLSVATGAPRRGMRLLTVGTDCSVGKLYTTLALHAEMVARGWGCDFRATGQTGIMISGDGIPIDAVVADFVAGAAEALTPAADADHWDVVEGQGSLFHPSYAGVALGLLHGAQPSHLVLCHEPRRPHIRGLPGQPVPGLEETMTANLQAARLTAPEVRCCGISLNTSAMEPGEARALCDDLSERFGLPCVDPVRTGVGAIVDGLAP
jgi:uncharacterized NAD-dependent epimerase/dehydratase family protein